MTLKRSNSHGSGALAPDLAEVWRAERARARGTPRLVLMDAVDELRARGLVVAIGVRRDPLTGMLSIIWADGSVRTARRHRAS